VTLPETALVIMAMLMLALGTIDLGVGLFHWHVLSNAAREGVRRAAVHGRWAGQGLQTPGSWVPWGPSTYGPQPATDSDVKAQAVALFLTGLNPSTVNVTYEWPDNSNDVEKQVRVTLSTTWHPTLLFFFGNRPITLSASSTMSIAH